VMSTPCEQQPPPNEILPVYLDSHCRVNGQ
jgi:hypothetical protein